MFYWRFVVVNCSVSDEFCGYYRPSSFDSKHDNARVNQVKMHDGFYVFHHVHYRNPIDSQSSSVVEIY